jgi:hypothetical protein
MATIQSTKWNFNLADLQKVSRNALLFLAPVLIVELELIQQGADFSKLTIAFQVWILGVVLDTLRKFSAGAAK